MKTVEIEVTPNTLKVLFLELQDREVLIKHIMEEIRELQESLSDQHEVAREIRADIKAHLGIEF